MCAQVQPSEAYISAVMCGHFEVLAEVEVNTVSVVWPDLPQLLMASFGKRQPNRVPVLC